MAAAGHTVALALHPSRGCGKRQPMHDAKQALDCSVRRCALGSFPASPGHCLDPPGTADLLVPRSFLSQFWMPGLPFPRGVGQELVSKMTRLGECKEQSLSCWSANDHCDKPDRLKPFLPIRMREGYSLHLKTSSPSFPSFPQASQLTST